MPISLQHNRFKNLLGKQEICRSNQLGLLKFEIRKWKIDVVQGILERLPEYLFPMQYVELVVDNWSNGRIILLGESSCALLHSSFLGASFAMESAVVLSEELSRSGSSSVDLKLALSLWQTRRLDRLALVRKYAQDTSHLISSNPILAITRNTLVKASSSIEHFATEALEQMYKTPM